MADAGRTTRIVPTKEAAINDFCRAFLPIAGEEILQGLPKFEAETRPIALISQ